MSAEHTAYAAQGTDWIDLASDQRTVFYTSEYGTIFRYDLRTHTQLPPFAYVGPGYTFALRLLPPGDGTGGLLVAADTAILRLDGSGREVQRYGVSGEARWFALNISPDGRTFWSGNMDTGHIYQFDIPSGRVLTGPIITSGSGSFRLSGLCVKLEYTAAQEICGNGVDDDGDGSIDENCQRLEICANGIDDDGDLLDDAQDPECNRPPETRDWLGVDRIVEDTLLVRPSPGTNLFLDFVTDPDCGPQGCDADDLTIDILSAPAHGTMTLTVDGIDMPVVAGLSFPFRASVRNADGTLTPVGQGPATIVSMRYDPADNFCGEDSLTYRVTDPKGASSTWTYGWTVTCANDAPVAVDDSYTTPMNTALVIGAAQGVLANDTDIDGDGLSVTSASAPANGTATVNPNGSFTYTPNAGHFGSDSFTYTVSDGKGGTATATVTITIPSNQPPACTAAAANPLQIWPPNHKFVRIAVEGVTDPNSGGALTITVTSIFQDEPTNTDGDGNHTPDGRITTSPDGSSTASVRAERSGTKRVPGNGRVYHISFTATDPAGASCSGVVRVCVPYDQRPGAACVDKGPLYNSLIPDPPPPGHDEDHCDDERHDHRKPKKDKDRDDDRGKKK